MAIIPYTRYYFKEPDRISPDQYGYYRNKLISDPAFVLDVKDADRFTGHFRKTLIWFMIGLLTCLLFLAIYVPLYPEKADHLEWERVLIGAPVMIGGAIAVLTLGRLLLAGPSFATYVTDRNNYFAQLKYAISSTSDYQTFCKIFYPEKANGRPVVKMLAQEAGHRLTVPHQRGMDKVLTYTFYWIDKHMWKVFLLAAAAFLIKKYVIK